MVIRNLLLATLILTGLYATAQSRIYLKPSTGIGFSNVKEKYNGLVSIKKTQAITSYNATLGIGYKKNKIGIETGIGYLKTGKKMPNTLWATMDNPIGTKYAWQINNHHIIVPLRISYQFNINRKLSLSPVAGGSLTYNFGASNKMTTNGITDLVQVPGKTFRRTTNPISLFGEGQLNATYKINKTIDIFGGPALQYMITNMAKQPADATYEYKAHPYTIGVNAGIILYLPETTRTVITEPK